MAGGVCRDRIRALPIGKAHIRYHGKGLESVLKVHKKNRPLCVLSRIRLWGAASLNALGHSG